ncbi:MAG: hypothetical protein R3C14_24510 [Caldilineaceae bacterium]
MRMKNFKTHYLIPGMIGLLICILAFPVFAQSPAETQVFLPFVVSSADPAEQATQKLVKINSEEQLRSALVEDNISPEIIAKFISAYRSMQVQGASINAPEGASTAYMWCYPYQGGATVFSVSQTGWMYAYFNRGAPTSTVSDLCNDSGGCTYYHQTSGTVFPIISHVAELGGGPSPTHLYASCI